jgi:hypothetical protein
MQQYDGGDTNQIEMTTTRINYTLALLYKILDQRELALDYLKNGVL